MHCVAVSFFSSSNNWSGRLNHKFWDGLVFNDLVFELRAESFSHCCYEL